MELIKLFNLQGSLFIMILAGAVLKRKGIIDEPGKRCLTDLCVNIIIPCNIVKSCLIEFDISIMKACGPVSYTHLDVYKRQLCLPR